MAIQQLSNVEFIGGAGIAGLPASTASGQPVVHEQLAAAIEGLAWKDSCRVSTQGNVDLASPGATVDGVTMVTGDRMLVRAQSAPAANGIYIWNGAATPATRSPDANASAELNGAVVTVDAGTDANTTWRHTGVDVDLGTDAITWTSFGTSAPSASETVAGVVELATLVEADAGTDDARAITPEVLANSAFRARSYSALVGDGSNTSYAVTHNLGSRDVSVSVYRNSGNYDEIGVESRRTDTNTVTLVFASPPTTDQFRVVVERVRT